MLLPIPLLPVLFLTAALNGTLLGPLLIFLYKLCNDAELMGDLRNGRLANVLAIAVIGLLLLLTGVVLALALTPSG